MQCCARRLWTSLFWITLLGSARLVSAQAGAELTSSRAVDNSAKPTQPEVLAAYLKAFAAKHLISVQTANVAELRSMLRNAEELAGSGRNEDAALILYELTMHPRFADYAELEEMDAAYYALGGALHALGAESSARAALWHVLGKGPSNPYFAPAFRSYVDVALAGQPLLPSIRELTSLSAGQLPEDAQNELYYLEGRERYDAQDLEAAKQVFARVTRHSRFYANAEYLLGELATRDKLWSDAEAHFCKIQGTGDDHRFSFYVDGRYFRIKDLARLGLGRVAHEQRRADDAFYYYFQVPNDSPRLPEAMFEAAYARYEGKDFESASDLLDQLQARFPRSAYVDEASLLRGYVALAHCDFDAANRQFETFNAHFEPVLEEIDRILKNPTRREALYDELRVEPESHAHASAVHHTLLALLRIDPVFSDLHERVIQLDRESAQSSRLHDAFELLAARYQGSDRPRALSEAEADPTARQTLDALREELADARQAARALTQQLDAMRALGARASELAPLETDSAALATRLRKLESSLDDARLETLSDPVGDEPSGQDVPQLLAHDGNQSLGLERRVLALRPKLIAAANDRALGELRGLRERLAGFIRRARIGRIDAVMGSKRRVEIQIESLAAGRFPAELRNPLLIQGFLKDDEEYWPFEGEDWPDEYLERYGDAASAAPRAPLAPSVSPRAP
jgi:TolA-binding protein